MYSGRPGFYHCLHQFKRVERASESCFCVSYYRREPVDFPLAVHELYLVCSLEGLIDPLYQMRDAVGRVQALVWVSLACEVSVRGYLPAAHVNCLESGLNH